MRTRGKRPYLFARIHGIHARFVPRATLLSCFAARDPGPALPDIDRETAAAPGDAPATLAGEQIRQRRFMFLLSRLFAGDRELFALVAALAGEYEIRNIALFLGQDGRAETRWHETPPGSGLFGAPVFSLAPDTVRALLAASPYRDLLPKADRPADPLRLARGLEAVQAARVDAAIAAVPGADRQRLARLEWQRRSLRATLTALRLRAVGLTDNDTILERAAFPDAASRAEAARILDREPAGDLIATLPGWARTRARDLLAERPELAPAAATAEPVRARLETLERLAAGIMHRAYRNQFHYYGDGLAPAFCFYFLLRRELENVAILLNAIRCGLDEETFRRELVD